MNLRKTAFGGIVEKDVHTELFDTIHIAQNVNFNFRSRKKDDSIEYPKHRFGRELTALECNYSPLLDVDRIYKWVRAIMLKVPIQCIGTYNSIALIHRYKPCT